MTDDDIYSAKRDDLFFPFKRGNFFAAGVPKTEAALCAEIARLAYCRPESNFAFDRDRIRSVLGPVGFTITNDQFYESTGNPQGGGTHCFLALRADAEKDEPLAIVAFRGTDKDDPTDLADDADIIPAAWDKGGKVHQGFAKALNEVRPNLDTALRSVTCRLLFTGHSLGAALATLLASIRIPDFLYVFGSPRVGNAEFVATLRNVQTHRYVDCCDIVTRMPPEIFGYVHHDNPYYIDRNRNVTFNPSDDFISDDRVLAEGKYLAKYAWKPGNVAVRDLADHAPINYVLAVTANQS